MRFLEGEYGTKVYRESLAPLQRLKSPTDDVSSLAGSRCGYLGYVESSLWSQCVR